MATTISFGIQKGGAAKSTTAGIIAYLFSKKDRVLVVDRDCQGNLTEMITNTAANEFHERTVLEAIKAKNAGPFIHRVSDHLHVLPANNLLTLLGNVVT